jgi:hypothetical protein
MKRTFGVLPKPDNLIRYRHSVGDEHFRVSPSALGQDMKTVALSRMGFVMRRRRHQRLQLGAPSEQSRLGRLSVYCNRKYQTAPWRL